jgi:hypothetical protein
VSGALDSKLTLITVSPPLSHHVLAGVLSEAAEAVPDDVVAHRVRRGGHADARGIGRLSGSLGADTISERRRACLAN